MLHTKTPTEWYDDSDYWTVSYIDVRSDNPEEYKKVVKEYGDCDNAYEDYYYYKKQWWTRNCQYEHHKR